MTAPSPDLCTTRWDCVEPGSLVRCQLCPHSPTYWRRSLAVDERARAEAERVERVKP